MGQITIEKNVAGIEGLCVITPAVHGVIWKKLVSILTLFRTTSL